MLVGSSNCMRTASSYIGVTSSNWNIAAAEEPPQQQPIAASLRRVSPLLGPSHEAGARNTQMLSCAGLRPDYNCYLIAVKSQSASA